MPVNIIFILYVLSGFFSTVYPYTVPTPTIEVFHKGFRISIPDHHGIQLFAFHGKINEEMRHLEAGTFSMDILTNCAGRWVFEDKDSRLGVGDVLYFWLYVRKDGLGYRKDGGEYFVDGIKSYHPLHCSSPPSLCCELFQNVTHRAIDVSKENQKLKEENQVLSELALRDKDALTLKIQGKYPKKYFPSPEDFVRAVIVEKLKLQIEVSIVEVSSDEVRFVVEELMDKVQLIVASKRGLEGSNYKLLW